MRFAPVPYEAIHACLNGAELGLVLDIYQRAHRCEWRAFQVTERSLKATHKIGNSRLWSLLGYLEELDLLEMDRGSRGIPTRLTVVCPTKTARQEGVQQGVQESEASNDDIGEVAAASAAAVAATLIRRPETETRDLEKTRVSFEKLSEAYGRLRKAQGYKAMTIDIPRKADTKTTPGCLLWLVEKHSLPDLLSVFDYLTTSDDDRPGGASFYREKKLRPVNIRANFSKLLELSRDQPDQKADTDSLWQEARKCAASRQESTDPTLIAIVKRIGGWDVLCAMTDRNERQIRQDFNRAANDRTRPV